MLLQNVSFRRGAGTVILLYFKFKSSYSFIAMKYVLVQLV